ncbi:hypothetical protein KPH14_000885 [Odynerus spinipes]|uniref:Integrase zinc-binding domain-containing protein n=1 Tax=Odynerus spinipes TaxID=1348599 RepID=A0AAD9VMF9_9HYME|nr:hypothetical protein KPH14_000885 [Odynerus spinipes]
MYEKESTPLEKIRLDPIVMLWSQDLDESNQYSDYIKTNSDTSQIEPSANGISKLENRNQIIYLLHAVNLHFEKLEYKNIFESLKNLKSIIKNKKFILVPPEKHININPAQLYEMLAFLFPKNEIKIFDMTRIVPKNQDEIKRILEENHGSKLSGHYGFNKTYSKIKENYYWPTIKVDIRKHIKGYHSCQINKTNFKPTRQPMEITTTSEKPFERLALDIVGPLPLT